MSEGILDSSLRLGKELRWQVVELGLHIHDQEPDRVLGLQEVDDASPAALATAARRPAHLPTAAAAWDEAPANGWVAIQLTNSVRSSAVHTSAAYLPKMGVSATVRTAEIYGRAVRETSSGSSSIGTSDLTNHATTELVGKSCRPAGKYDASQAGSLVWYVGELNGDYLLPTTLNGKGLSHVTTFFSEARPPQEIPEPGSLALLGVALAGLGLARRAKSK